MERCQSEIVILKPTTVFQAFLAAQKSEHELPDLELLQTDPTAYVIKRQASEEETVDEIERHFPRMFKHEISRWLGDDARSSIEGSFLDFLCCFKFELHSQIILMEKTIAEGRQLLSIKPRSVLIKWMKAQIADQEDDLTSILDRVNLANLAENATVVVKNFNPLTQVKPFLKCYWRQILQVELSRMCDKADQWPAIDCLDEFSRYFSVAIHTQLIHLD